MGTPVEALMPTGAEVTYSISGVTGRFDINSATGQITIAGDIAARAYPATVTATFTESQYPYTQVGAGSIAVTITVTSQGQWRQYAKLTASDGADGDRLGESLALDPATGTIVSGAPEVGNSAGAVYVFEGPDDTAPVKLTPPPGTPNELFGMSVVVDGDVIAVGTRCQCADAKVYVYKKSTAGWATAGTPTAALSAPTSDVDFDDGLAATRFLRVVREGMDRTRVNVPLWVSHRPRPPIQNPAECAGEGTLAAAATYPLSPARTATTLP